MQDDSTNLHPRNSASRTTPKSNGIDPENLAQRVRTGADAFAFDALLNGVEYGQDAQPEPPVETGRSGIATLMTPGPASSEPRPSTPVVSVAEGVSRRGSSPPPPAPGPGRKGVFVLVGVAALAGVAGSLAINLLVPHPKVAAPATPTEVAIRQEMVLRGLPDPAVTPGDLGSGASIAAPHVQQKVLATYGIDPSDKRFVLCNLIPLSLGGSQQAANLFPTTPWFAALKGRVDKALTAQVNSGKMSKADAIAQLKANWVKAAHSNYVRNYGQRDATKAKAVEDKLKW